MCSRRFVAPKLGLQAREARHGILLFLDSHAEPADGWMEPLVARIHEDRTRVVIPNIRGFDLDTLALSKGDPWPPSKGSLNWRLSYVRHFPAQFPPFLTVLSWICTGIHVRGAAFFCLRLKLADIVLI